MFVNILCLSKLATLHKTNVQRLPGMPEACLCVSKPALLGKKKTNITKQLAAVIKKQLVDFQKWLLLYERVRENVNIKSMLYIRPDTTTLFIFLLSSRSVSLCHLYPCPENFVWLHFISISSVPSMSRVLRPYS